MYLAIFVQKHAPVGVAVEAGAEVDISAGLDISSLSMSRFDSTSGFGSWVKLPVMSNSSGTICRFGTSPKTAGTILPAMPLLASMATRHRALEVQEAESTSFL